METVGLKSFKMTTVRIKDLKEGMVPAKEVRDRMGRLILGAGKRITPRHIQNFKAWGVTEIEVEDPQGVAAAQISLNNPVPQVPESCRQEAKELFRYTDLRHPAISELFELCLLRKLEALKEKEERDGPRS
ncbi:MAG: hypothetical protein GWM98_29865 [Nitrospinaceae bacterium]|nr:hypothetical protein [Nitrospinaceae bacterium]NIR57903.1 hypothetical protein [Nitrospinaceae bacterium]NIS88361.1 hypothetical protein [Nitrospinaceae bacterium]NIT85239.1 hypothetical protein [Nitrospinaceae bacterium]NIU47392.1 hypothetical protein [Nitrospinaceae bacterium]